MLLNLSNHPSLNWSEAQKQAAAAKYGEIRDLPFPQIDPEWEAAQVRQLAEEYESEIRENNPTAVHIMGEMTFCFKLITRLNAIGILCIASTTERIVMEKEGVKTSTFKFVQFREYYNPNFRRT